jgi:hypothetical protein
MSNLFSVPVERVCDSRAAGGAGGCRCQLLVVALVVEFLD